MYHSGIILGFFTQIVTLMLGLYTTDLLIKWKNLANKDSYSSIGYVCYGRVSVFLVSGAIAFLCLGMPISYLIIYADSATPLAVEFLSPYFQTDYRTLLIIVLSIFLSFFCIKREMHELRIASMASTFWAWVFWIMMIWMYIIKNEDAEHSLIDFLYPTKPLTGYFRTAPNIFLAYWFQQSFFTVFKSLEHQTDENGWKLTYRSFFISATIYGFVTFLSIAMFGDEMESDVMNNIAKSKHALKYFCLILFLVIAAMHTPIIFFVGKEGLLVFYAELRYRAISSNPDKEALMSKTLRWQEYYPITVITYLLVILAALLIHDLGKVFALWGSLSATTIAFVGPPVFYMKLKGMGSVREMLLPVTTLVFGLLFTVIGWYSNLFI